MFNLPIPVARLCADDKQQLNRIEFLLSTIISKETTITMTLAQLKTQVDANASVEGSALALIQGIAAQLQAALANEDDPAAIQALADELSASAAPLAAAVAANTPAAPAPPTPPAGS